MTGGVSYLTEPENGPANQIEIIASTFGFTPRLIANRENKTYHFEDVIKLSSSIQNGTAIEANNIQIEYNYDPNCLEARNLPDHDGGCVTEEPGKIKCSENQLEPWQKNDFELDFLPKQTECTPAKISMTASFGRFTDSGAAKEEVNIKEQIVGTRPILTTNLSDISYHYFCPPNTITPTGCANFWENHVIVNGDYLPNIKAEDYSGVYFFQYANYSKAVGPEHWAEGFMPIREKIVLVDGFDQYEIYALPQSEYIASEGVTRENGNLVAIVKDPSAETVEINNLDFCLADPRQICYFAIFEVRESGETAESAFVRLPEKITKPVTDKQIAGQNAVWGHLISSSEELMIDFSAAENAVSKRQSPQKREWQIFEQEGEYTSLPVKTNADGEIKLGVNANRPIEIAKRRINSFAPQQFLAAIYYSTDTRLSPNDEKDFFISSNRTSADFFNLNLLTARAERVGNKSGLYGVVFDAWTGEILPENLLEISGQKSLTETAEAYRTLQATATDGLFNFNPGRGSYQIDVQKVHNRFDTYVYPSNLLSGEDTFAPFKNLYFNSELTLDQSVKHLDIPVDPAVNGVLTNTEGEIYELLVRRENRRETAGRKYALPVNDNQSRFSFFLPPGRYEIFKAIDQAGKEIALNQKLVIPDSNGDRQPDSSLYLELTLP
jgi:hypothetical protein